MTHVGIERTARASATAGTGSLPETGAIREMREGKVAANAQTPWPPAHLGSLLDDAREAVTQRARTVDASFATAVKEDDHAGLALESVVPGEGR
jgi:hypothetical protein